MIVKNTVEWIITGDPAQFVIGQIVGDEASYVSSDAVAQHVDALDRGAARMIPQVPYQLSNTSWAEIGPPGYLRETGLPYQRAVIDDYNIVIAPREIRWNARAATRAANRSVGEFLLASALVRLKDARETRRCALGLWWIMSMMGRWIHALISMQEFIVKWFARVTFNRF